MLNHGQVMDGLRRKAERFREAYKSKDYLTAMWIYNEVLDIAVFMQLDELDKQELFGKRGEDAENEIQGLFAEAMVERSRLWCIRNDKTRQDVVDTRYIRQQVKR